jgi:hypothetical protein
MVLRMVIALGMNMSLSALGRLPLRTGSADIAAECRATANELLQADAWGRAELAGWLAGPYRNAARFTNEGGEDVQPLSGMQRRNSTAPPPSETLVKHLVEQAQKSVLQTIEAATMDPARFDALAAECLRAGFVKHRTTSDGTIQLVPVDRERMTLVDRVLSLLVAARAETSPRKRDSGVRTTRHDPRREE